MSIVGLSAVFKKIVGLKNLRRVRGGRGVLKSFPASSWNGQLGGVRNPDAGWTGLRTYMTADQSAFWPIPSTLRVLWDE
jgi:linoleate 8R-lipoxygenase/9,12-octadecadienoate 8-hydroperoxide 8R-isomerase/linoleate 8R-lipoxygenase/9,12-octadecadienoate 8-hydroperoxide 8S-isomerase